MKKSFSMLLLTTIVLGGTLATGALPVSASQVFNSSEKAISPVFKNQSENLIKNGDFSNGLDSWQVATYDAGTITVKQEQDSNYVQLTHPTTESVSAIMQDIPSAQLKKYKLSFMYQGSPNGQLILEANDWKFDQHQVVGLFNLTDSSTAWHQFDREIVMPANGFLANWDSLTTGFIGGYKDQPATNTPLNIKNVQLTEIS
ncbi:hypothetical protein GKC32_06985 [Lactobacillus curvatus]|nr:hypothetical protein [Latilactobacillus curvatus]MSE24214.1 hypothetical protein [Latilactobacillus curvatus]